MPVNQDWGSVCKPNAYASRSLLSSECNYTQIEKELLAIVFACNNAESIMLKALHKVSHRLQRMRLKLQKYDLTVQYTKGKELYLVLSHAYLLYRTYTLSCGYLIATQCDEQMQKLHQYISTGWPTNVNSVPVSLRGFWKVRHDLHSAFS